MTNVEFAYDYASPWSYLASEILERSLPGVPVTYVPVYLRGFPNFQKGVPESISGRLNYLVADLRRCTARWEVPVSFPANFPLNGLYAVRGALWVQAHAPERFAAWHAAAYRAAWRDNRNIGDRAVVVEIAGEVGLDRERFSAGIEDPTIKEKLKQETAHVIARGAFGLPTFFVGSEMFFGHDRLEYVRREVLS
jgi:2-hydroxychromene-2-carboxylate isomerase